MGGGGYTGNTANTSSLAGINTLNSTPDAKSSSGFIQQINRISEQEAIDQGYTVIKTAQDLDNIRNDLDGKYILMNDIDLSSYSNWNPIGEVDVDAGTGQGFTGVLDGNGYTISNLTINRPDEDGAGLFVGIGDPNTMTGGEVKDLCLENVNIVGSCYVGGIAPVLMGNITNCCVIGNIFSNGNIDGASYSGALVGYQTYGTVSNSYAAGRIEGNGVLTGGLVGMNAFGTISNSYTSNDVTGSEGVGGLVGNNYGGIISNSYATGVVLGVTYVGGLVGESMGGGKLENSIWNPETTGQNIAYGYDDGMGVFTNNNGLTTSQMQDPTNWQGWDDTVWDFSTYPPKLKWQTQSSTNPGGDSDADDPNTPGGGDVPIPGAVRLQIGSDSSSTSAIYVDTSFDLGAFDVDFSSADSCAAAIEDIDEVLSRINTKRSEFGAVINRLSSILESQTTTIQNFTSAKSTIMDADIANESADFVKNQILQQTSSALLAQSQNLHASIVLSLIG